MVAQFVKFNAFNVGKAAAAGVLNRAVSQGAENIKRSLGRNPTPTPFAAARGSPLRCTPQKLSQLSHPRAYKPSSHRQDAEMNPKFLELCITILTALIQASAMYGR